MATMGSRTITRIIRSIKSDASEGLVTLACTRRYRGQKATARTIAKKIGVRKGLRTSPVRTRKMPLRTNRMTSVVLRLEGNEDISVSV